MDRPFLYSAENEGQFMEYMHENARPFFLEGGEHAVLLTHGFTASAAHMLPLAERLHRAGFTVQGILLPGHGTSMADMKNSAWQDWLSAELQAVHKLKEKYKYVSVCGLSMGGVLSLIAAEQTDVTACVPISTPVKIRAPFISLAKPASLFVKQMRWGPGSAVHDDRLMMEYNIGYLGYPTEKAHDLHILMKQAYRNLYLVSCPTLIIQSHADRTVRSVSAQMIYDGVSSTEKEILWLENVPHVCTISTECDHIAEKMIAYLRRAEK